MRYAILYTEIDDGERIIKIQDYEEDRLLLFYTMELPFIKEPGLKSFLFSKLRYINEGRYDEDDFDKKASTYFINN